jgi:hypothetical protein
MGGGSGPSPTRQVKLNKRTLTPGTARLSFAEIKTFGKFPCPRAINGLRFP